MFEPRSHFKSRLSLIVWLNVVLNRTDVVDSDWRFDNLCGSHLQSQSELYKVSWWYYTLAIDLIGQLRGDVIGRLSVKPWYYWPWRLVISNWCVSIRLLSQLNSRLLLVKLSVLQSFSGSYFCLISSIGNLRTTTKSTTTTSVDWERTGTRTSVSAGKRKHKMKSIGRSMTTTLNVNKHVGVVQLWCSFATKLFRKGVF